MYSFQDFWANSKLASYIRTFAAIVLFQAISEFQRLGQFDFTNLASWVITGLVAFLPLLSRVYNPQDQLNQPKGWG